VAPTAKSLILQFLTAAGGAPLSARLLVSACALFDVTSNNVRVALVRLSAEGLVEAAGRGEYRLAEGAAGISREVSSWRTALSRVRAWKGGYVVVHVGALGRTDRGALKRRDRALSLLGFAELDRGLHLRPDNLEGGVAVIRERLLSLGLPGAAPVFEATSLDRETEARARTLWDEKALNAGYKQTRASLTRWLSRFRDLEPEVAARESFLLGGRAIRQIVYDPLLPAPLVDVDERRAFVEAMLRMDSEGHRIWRRFFAAANQAAPRDGERLTH
jgi:phenylacetic acid degradation operon negative regulatory protein